MKYKNKYLCTGKKADQNKIKFPIKTNDCDILSNKHHFMEILLFDGWILEKSPNFWFSALYLN